MWKHLLVEQASQSLTYSLCQSLVGLDKGVTRSFRCMNYAILALGLKPLWAISSWGGKHKTVSLTVC